MLLYKQINFVQSVAKIDKLRKKFHLDALKIQTTFIEDIQIGPKIERNAKTFLDAGKSSCCVYSIQTQRTSSRRARELSKKCA